MEKDDVIALRSILKYGAIGTVLLIALILGFMSVKFIGVGERGVVFNKFTGVVGKTLDQGANFINPITDKVKKYKIRTTKETYDMEGLSADSQTIHCQLVVNYKLQAGKLVYIYQNVQGEISDTILQNGVIDTTKAELGKFTIDNIAKNRESLKLAIETTLRTRMAPLGIDIQNVSITNVDFSKEFENSIQAKMIAEQDALAAKNKKEKMRYESEAKAIENEKMATSVTPLVLRQKWIEKWDGHLPNVMTGKDANLLMNIEQPQAR